MNKYITHLVALLLGSSIALASPLTILAPTEATVEDSKPMCLLNETRKDECEVGKPVEEEKASTHTAVPLEDKKYQDLIQREMLQSMIEPVSFRAY